MLRGVIAVSFLVACFEEPGPRGPEVTSGVEHREIPFGPQSQLDLLFVVDNSPAMATHHATLLANARGFIEVVNAIPGGIPDLHLGVITTEGDGLLIAPPTVEGRFVTDSRRGDGVRELNYAGELSQVLEGTFEAAGTAGSEFTRPLEAVRAALAHPENGGFVRRHAGLAIVFLTSNDDCSYGDPAFLDGADAFSCVSNAGQLIDVDSFATELKATKDDPTEVLVLGAFGPAEPFGSNSQTRVVAPSCTIDQRSAQPARRMAALFDLFPNRSSEISICADDLAGALELVGQLIKTTLGAACFPTPLDVDPITGGAQYDCAAWLRAESFEERTLHACDENQPGPCWRLAPHPACDQAGSQGLFFDRYLPTTDPVTAIIECVVR